MTNLSPEGREQARKIVFDLIVLIEQNNQKRRERACAWLQKKRAMRAVQFHPVSVRQVSQSV